jgi:hypothetical protein
VLPLLDWLEKKGIYSTLLSELTSFPNAMTTSCLDAVKWFSERGWPWDQVACLVQAANEGRMDLLQWAEESDLLPSEEVRKDTPRDEIKGCARSGNLEVLAWMSEKGFQVCFNTCATAAAAAGHVHALKWLYEQKKGEGWEDRDDWHEWEEDEKRAFLRDLVGDASLRCHVGVLKWIWEICPGLTLTVNYPLLNAARLGNLEFIKFLKEKGCPPDKEVFLEATRWGQLHIPKWGMSSGDYKGSTEVTRVAAQCGDLEMLKWFRSRGCPWDYRVYVTATVFGGREILEWVMDNGCPWSEEVPVLILRLKDERGSKIAAGEDTWSTVTEIFEWFLGHGLFFDIPMLFKEAFRRGAKEVLYWLTEREREEGGTSRIKELVTTLHWQKAALTGNISALTWLKKIAGEKFCGEDFLFFCGLRDRNLRTLLWAKKKGYQAREGLLGAFLEEAEPSSLYMAQWFHKNVTPISTDDLKRIVHGNRPNWVVVRWAIKEGVHGDAELFQKIEDPEAKALARNFWQI